MLYYSVDFKKLGQQLMIDFIVKVKTFEGEDLELKVFAVNVYEVIDTMLTVDSVKNILTITRIDDGYVWNLGETIEPLRELRKEIDQPESFFRKLIGEM
jgi:hypothetical protein